MSNQVSNPATSKSMRSFDIMDTIRKEDSINVFVFNMTSKMEKSRAKNSNVMFTVQIGQQTTLINIPQTWVPINIGLQAPKDVLFSNSNFLKAVTQGMIKPITNDEARKFFLENDGAMEEFDSAMSRQDLNAQSIEEMQEMAQMPEQENELPSGVSPTIVNLIERYNDAEDAISESEAYSMVRTLESSLTKADIDYVVSNIKSERITAFVNKIKIK